MDNDTLKAMGRLIGEITEVKFAAFSEQRSKHGDEIAALKNEAKNFAGIMDRVASLEAENQSLRGMIQETQSLRGELDAMKQLHKDYRDAVQAKVVELESRDVLKDADLLDHIKGLIPEPVHGKDGQDGKDAEPVDMDAIVETITKLLPSEESIFKAINAKLPDLIPEPVAPNQLQVTEAVKTLYPTIRSEVVKLLPRIEHKGVHEAGREYEPGDEVIKGDSTYRAKHATSETPPHDDWQCIAKSKVGRRGDRGPDGTKGDKGDAGLDGNGVKEITVDDTGQFILEQTNGDVTVFDLTELIAKAVADFMNKGPKE